MDQLIKLNSVLLIDDSEADNFFHSRVIRHCGLVDHVYAIDSAGKAINWINQKAMEDDPEVPELIFLDLNMPEMDGWEFLTQYQLLKSKLSIDPVLLILTTSDNPADRERAELITEVNGFIKKPLNNLRIKRTVARYF